MNALYRNAKCNPKKNRPTHRLALLLNYIPVGLILLLLAACSTTTTANAHPASTPTPATGHGPSPIGKTWHLTVSFLPTTEGSQPNTKGSRAGQSEVSIMTFLPNGSLTATFPGATPDAPPTQPPVKSGTWTMTGTNTFSYQFTEDIVANGKTVVTVKTHIDAYLIDDITYVAGGVGIGYSPTGTPLPGQFNITQTTAVAS